MSQVLPGTGARPPLRRRVPARVAVLGARLLVRLCSPRRLKTVLRAASRGARPARYDEALAARRDVEATSTLLAGRYCLPRSVAVALLCRLRGTWPTWCTGVRTPPFAAHAWVEAEGRRVGEPADAASFHTMLSVPPRERPGPGGQPIG